MAEGSHKAGAEGRRSRPIILCALEFELQALHESESLSRAASMHCTGPGVDAALDFLLDLDGDDFGMVIYAGVAGALAPGLRGGDVRLARRVLSDDGEKWTATWPLNEPASRGLAMCDILTTRRILRLPQERRSAHETTGAELVDTESAALAAWAAKTNHRTWGVVRGVSDEIEVTLPDGIDHWIGRDGRLRPWRVGYDLLRQPRSIGAVRRLGESSKRAMAGVAAVLERLLGAGEAKA